MARIASIGLAAAGTLTTGIYFTPVAIGHRVVVGVIALAVGGGGAGIGDAIAWHD